MSKIDVVRAAMVEAMKHKDKARKDALSMLLSVLKNAEIDKRSPLTEDEENAVVKKEIKQCQETFDTAPADRADIREEAAQRIAVYKEFASEDMSVDQIKEVIQSVLSELGIEAVSYTHLDVYKRQPLRLRIPVLGRPPQQLHGQRQIRPVHHGFPGQSCCDQPDGRKQKYRSAGSNHR